MSTTYQEQYRLQQKASVEKLLSYFNGNKTAMARAIGLHPQNGPQWVRLGRVSREAARRFDADPAIPLTKEELRPDVLTWGQSVER